MRKPGFPIAGRIDRRSVFAIFVALGIAAGHIVFVTGSASATPGDILYVLEADQPLHAEPRAGSAVRGVLRRGQKALEFAREAGWTRVGVFGAVGLEGWLPTASLGRTPEDTDAAARGEPQAEEGEREAGAAEPLTRPRFDLAVEGSPGLAYSGECRILDAGETTDEQALRGLVPARYRFEAEGLRCILRKRDAFGHLIVTLLQDGHPIVRAETAAPYNHVRVRSDGPWGKARASRGAIAVPQFTPPDRPVPLIPPLRGPIVPPLSGSGSTTGGIPSIPPAP